MPQTTQVEVPLYVLHQSRLFYRVFYTMLTSMSCLMMVGCCCLSYATLTAFQTARKNNDNEKKSSLKWSLGSLVISLSGGSFCLATAWMLPQRYVRQLSYLPKRKIVKIGVSTPLGSYKDVLVPLNTIMRTDSSMSSSLKPLSLKVKGHFLFYFLKREGTFQSPKLFDSLIKQRIDLQNIG